jgi:hypothetical protein
MFADFVPAPSDRAFLSGKTGSGKTFAGRILCEWVRVGSDDISRKFYPGHAVDDIAPRDFVLGYDAKGLIRWKGYKRVTTFEQLLRAANNPKKYPKVMYAPVAKELRNRDLHEAFFRLCYERRNTTVYVDEWYSLCKGEDYPPSAHDILTRGREMNVPMIGCSQRPKNIPQPIMSEADLVFVFQLKMPRDREKMAELIPVDKDDLTPQALPKKQFFFYRDGDDEIKGPHQFSIIKQKPRLPS